MEAQQQESFAHLMARHYQAEATLSFCMPKGKDHLPMLFETLFFGVTAKRNWGPEGVQLHYHLGRPSCPVYFDDTQACWVVQFRPAVSLVNSQLRAFEQYVAKLVHALAGLDIPGLEHVSGDVTFRTSINRVATPSYGATHPERLIRECCTSNERKD